VLGTRAPTATVVRVAQRAAVWDLGSSSFQVLVCEIGPCRTIEPVMRRRALLNLGSAVGSAGVIPAERVAAAVKAARRLRRALDACSPQIVVALATAALRDATNGAEVVSRLEEVVGAPVRVLDGDEEARLCFVGQRSSVWMGARPTLGFDLGGGSFEVAVGDRHGVLVATSAPVGATRLRGELRTADPLSKTDLTRIRARTKAAVAEIRPVLERFSALAARTIASGGTARALARIAVTRSREHLARMPEVNQVELPAPQVQELASRLAGLDLQQRLSLPGMPTRRAAILPIGAAILATFAQELDVERFVVSEWGLREGALLDALERS
jgi:exopolyphosphatase / guanosine-5'-triphosphate,3'-diphosphate pyrophosphatase